MAKNFIFPEWLNANSSRAYPISERCTRMDTYSSIKLPDSLIVDASMSIHSALASSVFYVSKISVSIYAVNIEISRIEPDGAISIVGGISAPISGGNYVPYSFTGIQENQSITGTITVGELDQALTEISGVVDFAYTSTAFENTIANVSLPMIRRVDVYNGISKIGEFTDILKLKAGRNIELSYIDSHTVRIDAIDGLNTTDPDLCPVTKYIGPCIKTINGIPPDASGNFIITGGECIVVTPENNVSNSGTVGNSITISDVCSKSCCGCGELEDLVNGLRSVETQIQTLRSNISAVESNTSKMLGNIMGAL